MNTNKFNILIIAVLLLSACTGVEPTEEVQPTPSPAPTAGESILSWERTGGIAGFCDKVVIDAPGVATVENCKGDVQTKIELTAWQMVRLQEWQQTYQSFQYSQSDTGVADAMTITLTFTGEGQQAANDEEMNTISLFASDFAMQVMVDRNAPPEKEEAEKTLRDYLNALNQGDFILGAKLYGGSTELLQTWNPDINNDLPALIQRACTQNGLVCMEPLSVAFHGKDENGIYFFRVEFKNADGELFQQGPCCGEEEGITLTEFMFRVERTESGFAVLDLPPYVP